MNDNPAGHTTARHAVRDQLAALLPDPRIRQEDEGDTTSEITTHVDDGVHAVWKVSRDGGHVDVRLDGLTPAQARRIAVLVHAPIPQ